MLAHPEVVRVEGSRSAGRSRGAAASAGGERQRHVLRRHHPGTRGDRGGRAQPSRHPVPVRKLHAADGPLDAWPYPPTAGPFQETVHERFSVESSRLHPGLPVLPERHDHPPVRRKRSHRDHRRHGRERDPEVRRLPRRSGCSRSRAPRPPRSATSPAAWPTATTARTSSVAASTRVDAFNITWPAVLLATAPLRPDVRPRRRQRETDAQGTSATRW